jgi:membrane protein involved in colicin uptake
MHKIKTMDKKAIGMSLLVGMILVAALLMILLFAYIGMNKASGGINESLLSNMSALTGISQGIE